MPPNRPDLPPGHSAAVLTRGPWWTGEDPSLRVPRAAATPVAIWTVGEGPSLLLLAPAPCSHNAWAPFSLWLRETCTLHVIDRTSTSFADDVDRVVTAADAVGARYVAGFAADQPVLAAAARAAGLRALVLAPPGTTGHVPVSAGHPGALTATDASALIDTMKEAM